MAFELTNALHLASTACASAFILSVSIRLWKLRTFGIRTAASWQRLLKAAFALLLSIVLFAYWTKGSSFDLQHEQSSQLSLLISTIAALGLSLLLFIEQQRPLQISDGITRYLFASVICDLVYLTVTHNVAGHGDVSWPIFVRCSMQSILLSFEYRARRTVVVVSSNHKYRQGSPGVLSRLFFWWMIPILLQGHRNIFTQEDMPPLDQDMMPELTRRAMIETWSQRDKPETPRTLPMALLRCLRSPFLAAIPPRLLLVIFRYSQPILIHRSIQYATAGPEASEISNGYWLVVCAVVIYVGIAVSNAAYQNALNRLKLMSRSALVGLIHEHTMKLASVAYDNGAATTLMSTDADSLEGIGEMIHEIWAQVVEVLIGTWLLAGQVGRFWPLTFVLIYLCSHMSRFVAQHLHPGQTAWNNATQYRIAATSSVLKAMKIVKMLGYQDYMSTRIQSLRALELHLASKLRWIMVYYNASANALGIFSPAITLLVFAMNAASHGRKLDTETAFTTIAILSMITHPANMVMTIVPRVVGAMAGFDRIQTFLLRLPLEVHRRTLPQIRSTNLVWNSATRQAMSAGPDVQIRQVQIGDSQVLLENINLDIAAGTLTIISGPTGSGKSTLLRLILGEVAPARGSVSVSTTHMAYCAQTPWLPNGTIKQVIHGSSDLHDEQWYGEVVNACCLSHDLGALVNGDQTEVGSRGLNLSGGQRQRVALARALYARLSVILLDDTFSGLDGETERTVFHNLFGPSGMLKRLGTTVILVSNSAQYFASADYVVILSDHTITDQGTWQNIKTKTSSIMKFDSGNSTKPSVALSANFNRLSAQLRAKEETELDLARQTGDTALYGYYLGFVKFVNIFYLVCDTSIYSFCITMPQYWLRLWTEVGNSTTTYYIMGYICFSVVSWVTTSAQAWVVLMRLAPQSGAGIHDRLLKIIMSAPLSFFSTTDNGSILNRFSQDIQLIDKQLPSALQTIVTQVCKLAMQIIVLCTAEIWLTILFPICIPLIYIVQKVYLRSSRQLRYLELEARASVFSSFLESVEGLETIRAFGWSKAITRANVRSVEHSQRPEFLLLCLQRWLNLVLDLLVAGVATMSIIIAVVLREYVSGAQVGIALNIMLVANTTLLKLVENWTIFEISLGAISRLKTLQNTTPVEGGLSWGFEPPQNWPSAGRVEFQGITAAYHSDSAAIVNFSLDISPGQKLIVCGRTGSGKSTLLLTLLRLLELQSGKIMLDGIDISRVRLDLLRQRCFIAVTQDALLLPEETLRFNLNPDCSVTDKELIDALSKTGLWSHFAGSEKSVERGLLISSVGEHPVLDQKMSAFQNLSAGQCQLLSICRALVKAGGLRAAGLTPVVVLDEITSSLDTTTESNIYRIIDEEFTQNGHTVVIIAHRLDNLRTKMGRDAVVLMADGTMQEVRRDLVPSTISQLTGLG
ncbi:hypothetical protein PFICI_00022 [Pestalotiopsis fici W106-1]|uniref:ABC transporter n=1 Tax=Pestalotiopsis fici (strain W106-1 / CGMCC3.15140) TaxID=1229662 RepID=W3XJK0_PESFW|nr:uncharacterized protein PFICI_00022 [Pestalotiopsis fici W106-1]ETS86194.1 hypothetical protein PFICI_00022 [Pestalotiopsis fici W106-1]